MLTDAPVPLDRSPNAPAGVARRVLVVTTVHTPLDARIHARQVRSLVEAGWDVTYAAPFSGTGTDPGRVHDGVRTLDVPRTLGRDRLRALRGARRLLAEEGPAHDLVLLHDPDLLAAVAGQLRRLPPVVWDVHEDTAAALVDRPWVPRPLRPLLRGVVVLAERWAEGRMHLLLAEHGYRPRFRRDHPVVPNLPWATPVPDTEPSVDDRVVLLGRVARGRGGSDAVAAARRLVEHGIAVELVGPVDIDMRAEVAAAVDAGHVTSTGFVPNEVALGRLEGALAGLSLHRAEPNHLVSRPVKVLEYMGRGVPAVATRLPAVRDLVEHEGGGLLVDFAAPGQVAEAVRRLRDEPGLRTRLVKEGREAARQHSWDVAQHDFLEQLAVRARHPGRRG